VAVCVCGGVVAVVHVAVAVCVVVRVAVSVAAHLVVVCRLDIVRVCVSMTVVRAELRVAVV